MKILLLKETWMCVKQCLKVQFAGCSLDKLYQFYYFGFCPSFPEFLHVSLVGLLQVFTGWRRLSCILWNSEYTLSHRIFISWYSFSYSFPHLMLSQVQIKFWLCNHRVSRFAAEMYPFSILSPRQILPSHCTVCIGTVLKALRWIIKRLAVGLAML